MTCPHNQSTQQLATQGNFSTLKNGICDKPIANIILGEGKWQPTPVFLPGKSHGQSSLVGYSLWGRRRLGHDLVTKQHQHHT